jgi:hypothetical protein
MKTIEMKSQNERWGFSILADSEPLKLDYTTWMWVNAAVVELPKTAGMICFHIIQGNDIVVARHEQSELLVSNLDDRVKGWSLSLQGGYYGCLIQSPEGALIRSFGYDRRGSKYVRVMDGCLESVPAAEIAMLKV